MENDNTTKKATKMCQKILDINVYNNKLVISIVCAQMGRT